MASSNDGLSFKQTIERTTTSRRWMTLTRSRPIGGLPFPRRRRPLNLRRAWPGKVAGARAASEPHDLIDLDWYAPWVASQRSKLPMPVNSLLDQGRTRDADDGFRAVWDAIHKLTRTTSDTSIGEIVDHLETTGVFNRKPNDQERAGLGDGTDADAKRLLVFSILGWQSMVYLPELNSHPLGTLAVQHDSDGPDSGLVYDRYTITTPSAADMCDRPLWVMLKSFGNLLPAHPSDLAVYAADVAAFEISKTAASWTALYPDQLNAYLLHTLMRVTFRWVDTLALHLDYDKSTRTLSLFAFPSMCVAHLRARTQARACRTGGYADVDNSPGGAIFAFSSLEVNGADPRADEDDIAHFLREVLVSFRLLFGQSAKSRKLFRDIYCQADAPFRQPDTLLARLCDRWADRSTDVLDFIPPDRNIYYAARDFPVLYRRVELLADELKGAKPTSIRDLLNDRRDTLQFWTFWLVSVFGGISIFLALLQTALQAVQIAQAAGKI